MSEDTLQRGIAYDLELVRPFCLHISYDKKLVYLASGTDVPDGDRLLVVHRGTLGDKMSLAQTVCRIEEPTGYRLVDFCDDPVFTSIHYPPHPYAAVRPAFRLHQVAGWTPFMRVIPSDCEIEYFEDGTTRVADRLMVVPSQLFKQLKEIGADLQNAVPMLHDETTLGLLSSLRGLLDLIPELEATAAPCSSRDDASDDGTLVAKSLISGLVLQRHNFKGPHGQGYSDTADRLFFRGFYDLVRHLLASDGTELGPLRI